MLGLTSPIYSSLAFLTIHSKSPFYAVSALSKSGNDMFGLIAWGCGIGMFWSAIGVPLLYCKHLRRVACTLALVVGVAEPAFAWLWLLVDPASGSALGPLIWLGPHLAFLLACVILWRVLPDVYPYRSC